MFFDDDSHDINKVEEMKSETETPEPFRIEKSEKVCMIGINPLLPGHR